jgi:hypothetical protein
LLTRALFGVTIAAMLLGTALNADVLLNKKHKGMDGKDGARIDCAYCHQAAGKPKDGKNYEQHKNGPYCAMNGCH